MSDLHKAAQQALDWLYDNAVVHPTKVSEDLRAALAQEQAGSWQDGVLEGHLRERERWLAQEQAEPDLSRCPQCNGPADNGHDRSIPPHPYLCTSCMAEMPQPSYNVTVVDDAHPNGIPLEQWQNKQVQKPVAVSVDALAQYIRFVDGNNNLGAGILAEKIVEFLIKLGIGKEQAEPVEPVAWYQKRGQEVLTSHPACWGREDEPWTPLYTAPPQRKPLTDEEIYGMYNEPRSDAEMVAFARAVEAAHGIKE